jgi:peptidoglycan/xylan/chitin deacetylase (PgdA/CDA1 family)
MSRALILTYHAVEQGPPPLCIEPGLLERHLDAILESGAAVLTVGELGDALCGDRLPERAVAISFDDGFASVPSSAAPLLAERGLVATIFCVAQRLGGRSDWPSRAAWAPTLPLASGIELAQLAAAGWEIGSHGLDHDALAEAGELRRELAASRRLLEGTAGGTVRSFAFPYGIVPKEASGALVEAGFTAACTTRVAVVRRGADPFALPRVDAHYLRRPELFRAALAGRLGLYLRARDGGARIRRLARRDYVPS